MQKNYSAKGDVITLNTDTLNCPACRDLLLTINTANMAAGESYVFTLEGRFNDTVGWSNMSATGATHTVTEDGDLMLSFDGHLPNYVQVSSVAVLDPDSIASYTVQASLGVVS